MTFDTIDYLRAGSNKQQRAYHTLAELGLLDKLRAFTPLLAGTIPLGIDTDASDLDILCHWTHKHDFVDQLIFHFAGEPGFSLQEKVVAGHDTVLAAFAIGDFNIEIFGQNRPVKEQEGYRHMVVEYGILQKRDEAFKAKIIALKKAGIKTEPAFAQALGLAGDPYQALLEFKDAAPT